MYWCNETRLKLRVQPDTFRRCIKRSVATRFANWSNRHWASVVVTVAKSAGPGTASVLLNFSTHWLALFIRCSFELTVDFLDYMDDILALQSAGVYIYQPLLIDSYIHMYMYINDFIFSASLTVCASNSSITLCVYTCTSGTVRGFKTCFFPGL